MSELSSILDHVPAATLVIFRIGGLMIYGPIFGAPVIPVRIKVLLTFVLGLACYPVLHERFAVGEGLELNLFMLAPLMMVELMIGLMIGFVASLPLVAVQVGGLVMGQQMGLGFARFFNPAMEDDADVLGQVLFFMALTGFLMIGGHEAMILAVLHSFEHIAVGGFDPGASLVAMITAVLGAAFELALRVAAPLLCLIFLQTVAMGFVTKTVPQLNILSLGFPVRILAGVLIVTLGLTIINDLVMGAIDDALNLIFVYVEHP
ncbi:MAG: flagellar biosynthetic protein FliR [Planctomycetota bacterium]|jgi:flagellar biosynthetic protein FliR